MTSDHRPSFLREPTAKRRIESSEQEAKNNKTADKITAWIRKHYYEPTMPLPDDPWHGFAIEFSRSVMSYWAVHTYLKSRGYHKLARIRKAFFFFEVGLQYGKRTYLVDQKQQKELKAKSRLADNEYDTLVTSSRGEPPARPGSAGR